MQKTLSVINLKAIRSNALKIKSALNGKKFFAVVKADAYGHGAVEVAGAIEDIVDGFCVAITDEGADLRVNGITKPILVFAPPCGNEDVARARMYSLTVTVNSVETARKISGLPCHIKVNTGMNRLGCNLEELGAILKILNPEKIEGVYSHLYAPQNNIHPFKQLKLFEIAERKVREINPEVCAHISASGGFLRGGNFLKDGVRCGILLYGYTPDGFFESGFKPALKVYAHRTQITPFIGGGVGYNIADKNYKELCCYRLGYADGFSRIVPLGEKTLCMDAFIKNGGNEWECVFSDAREYARRSSTITYEVLTSVTKRSKRVYVR